MLFYEYPSSFDIFYDTIMSIFSIHDKTYKSNIHVHKFIEILKKFYNFHKIYTLSNPALLCENIDIFSNYYNIHARHYLYANAYLMSLVKINTKTHNNLKFYKKIYQTIINKLNEYKMNKIKFMKLANKRMLKDFEYVAEEYDVNAKLLDSIASISIKTNKYDSTLINICNTLLQFNIRNYKYIISTRFDLTLYNISYNYDITKLAIFIDKIHHEDICENACEIQLQKYGWICNLTKSFILYLNTLLYK